MFMGDHFGTSFEFHKTDNSREKKIYFFFQILRFGTPIFTPYR